MKKIESYMSNYRPDIDGLRGIAIVFVVLYHFFPTRFQGGFIGVDIFFVISGFLISSIILSHIEIQQFSLLNFYNKRILRLFPALSLVLILTLIVGWFVLFPDEYEQLGKHIISGTLFFSNLRLLNESGYFDNDAMTKPLLHLWSLGIEEQFYIVWPLLLILFKNKMNIFWIIFFLVLSFLANIYFIETNKNTEAFYLPYTRFWELLLGSTLAYIKLYKQNIKVIFPNVISIISILVLSWSLFYLDHKDSYPGVWALIPTLASLGIIYAGLNEKYNVLYTNKLVIFFGLISYPLYLLHWPFLSFVNIVDGGLPSREHKLFILVVVIFLAWSIYYFIERKVRNGSNTTVKVWISLIFMSLIAICGVVIMQMDGVKYRFKDGTSDLNLPSKINIWKYTGKECKSKFYKMNPEFKDQALFCMEGNQTPTLAVIGDSHAMHLHAGFSKYIKNNNYIIVGGTGGQLCHPFEQNTNNCINYIDDSIKLISQYPELKTVLLSSSVSQKKISYEKVVQKLKEHGVEKIYILSPTPEFPTDPRNCLNQRPFLFFGNAVDCSIPISTHFEMISQWSKAITDIQKKYPDIEVLESTDVLCDGKICSATDDSKLLYMDTNHLSVYGSEKMGKYIEEKLF